jgi:hypothetical protein
VLPDGGEAEGGEWIRLDAQDKHGSGKVSQSIEEHYRDVLENVPGISSWIEVRWIPSDALARREQDKEARQLAEVEQKKKADKNVADAIAMKDHEGKRKCCVINYHKCKEHDSSLAKHLGVADVWVDGNVCSNGDNSVILAEVNDGDDFGHSYAIQILGVLPPKIVLISAEGISVEEEEEEQKNLNGEGEMKEGGNDGVVLVPFQISMENAYRHKNTEMQFADFVKYMKEACVFCCFVLFSFFLFHPLLFLLLFSLVF